MDKKILVRAPSDLTRMILAIPFIHLLKSEYPQAEMNIIVDEGKESLYKVLPFEVRIFPLPKEKDDLLGSHHFAYNLNEVFNIDLYFDLISDFRSALLGFFFNSKERVGVAKGISKLFYTHKILAESAPIPADEFAIELLRLYTKKTFPNTVVSGVKTENAETVRVIEPLFKEHTLPFSLVIAGPLKSESIEWRWHDYFDSFVDHRFVILDIDNNLRWRDLALKFSDKNKYHLVSSSELGHLIHLSEIAKSRVTDQVHIALILSYLEKKSIIFLGNEETMSYTPYFKESPDVVRFVKSSPIKIVTKDKMESIEEMTKVADFVCKVFSI